MNKEQMRIAIAAGCGGTIHDKHEWDERDDRRYFVCLRCDAVINFREYSKGYGETNARCSGTEHDYPNDLNAMADAESTLPDDNSMHGLVVYHNKLLAVCGSHKACISATAEQRAEAFLKTVDRWVE